MVLTQAPPVHLRRKPRRCGSSGVYDPSYLSARIRVLAVQAHRLIREIEENEPVRRVFSFGPSADPEWELSDVHAQTIGLERTLRAHGLESLADYVRALRKKVGDYVGEFCLDEPAWAG